MRSSERIKVMVKVTKSTAVRLKTSLRNPKNLREKSMNHHNVHKPKLLGGLLLHVRTGAPFRSENTRGGMHTHAACGYPLMGV